MYTSFFDELVKIAAVADVRKIKWLLRHGKLDEAEQLARTSASVAKRFGTGEQPLGSFIGRLGSGAEDVAMLAVTPRGLKVQKLPIEEGVLGNPRLRHHKAEFTNRVQHPSVVPTSSHEMEGLKLPVLEQEFVPGQTLYDIRTGRTPKGRVNRPTHGRHAIEVEHDTQLQMGDLHRQAQEAGYNLGDVHAGNIVIDARTGRPRVVDTLPIPTNEPPLQMGAGIPQRPEPRKAFNEVIGKLKRHGFEARPKGPVGGAPPPGGAGMAGAAGPTRPPGPPPSRGKILEF